MKRIISVFIICILLASLSTVSLADMSYTLSTNSNSLTLSGTGRSDDFALFELIHADLIDSTATKTAEEILAIFKAKVKSGSPDVAPLVWYLGQAEVLSDGTWSHLVTMPSSGKGRYIAFGGDEEHVDILYAPLLEQYKIITDTKELAPILRSSHIASNMVYMTSYFDLYKSLANQANVNQMTADGVYNIETALNPTEEQKIVAIAKMANIANTAIVIEALNESRMSITIDDILAVSSDSSLTKSNMTAAGQACVTAALKGRDFTGISAFINALKEQIRLNEFNYTTGSVDAPSLKLKMDSMILKLSLNVSDSGYNNLSDSLKAQAAKKMYDAKCKNTQAFTQKLKSVVLELALDNTYNPPGGGGGSGGGGFGGGAIVVPDENTAREEWEKRQHAPFSDLGSYQWAGEAIDKLYSTGVIAGYEDGTFRPQNNITRAEFLKLIVEMFYGNEILDTDSVFLDVSDNSWYKDYVMTAYTYGIALGDGSNFRPNDYITRQDAAVLLFRAAEEFGLLSQETAGSFADDAAISDYAKNPINILKAHKIVSGDENGLYNPLKTTNRAEAAQMLFNMMSLS